MFNSVYTAAVYKDYSNQFLIDQFYLGTAVGGERKKIHKKVEKKPLTQT